MSEVTMTIEGQLLGTPAYMSPEQARGDGHQVDGRSDLLAHRFDRHLKAGHHDHGFHTGQSVARGIGMECGE